MWKGRAHTREQGETQCGRNSVSAPHTQQYLSAVPRPPCSRTELANLNKRSPPPASVRAEIRHGREGKQKPNKQREPLQKGLVQQIKIPVETPTTLEGAYRYQEV